MAWDQGPYPMVEDCVDVIAADAAARTIADEKIDIVYGLFQVYERALWGPPAPGIDADVWALLRTLITERAHGVFDVPIIFHWGFDVHHIDTDVARALDGQIFCNREQLAYWTTPRHEGGPGLDCFDACPVVAFFDSDRPKAEFMNDDFAGLVSSATGELHTVCIGRPFNIDYVALARNGIHLHLYGNGVDDTVELIARELVRQETTTRDVDLVCELLHLHQSKQTTGMSWPEVQAVKSQWVHEFSRYDAGWSYIGSPYRWAPMEDRSAIPNRLSTYLLAGLPVIAETRPGFHRSDELVRLGVNIELEPTDYAALQTSLATENRDQQRRRNARVARYESSFEATIPSLLEVFEQARETYFCRDPQDRRQHIAASLQSPTPVTRVTADLGMNTPRPSMTRTARRYAGRARARLASASTQRRCRAIEQRVRVASAAERGSTRGTEQ